MKRVAILVPQGEYILSSVAGVYKVFAAANAYLQGSGRLPYFKIVLVGLSAESPLYNGMFTVKPEVQLANAGSADLVVIPAIQPQSTAVNAAYVPWIKDQYNAGAEVASLCVGAFLLATTGLLNGRNCSTHWMAADAFQKMFPDVKLNTERIITDEQGIYTSGGAYSFLNLLLYLVEKYCGREVAIFISKQLEIDVDRHSQSPFTIFNGQKEHEDEPIREAQNYIEQNVGERITVDELAGRFAISRRNFERRFKKATSNTPVEYMQRVKIEVAKKRLESGRDTINEVMYSVGYSDSKAFRSTFKKFTGVSPLDYKRRYNRGIEAV